MGRLAVVVAICAAMLVTTAEAQTKVAPTKPPGSGTSGGAPHGNDPGSAERERATTSAPNLRGSLPSVPSAPNVQQQKPITVAPAASPPKAARPGSPDGGGTSECNCYRMERELTRNRDGSITQRWTQRLDGTKSLACCPRR